MQGLSIRSSAFTLSAPRAELARNDVLEGIGQFFDKIAGNDARLRLFISGMVARPAMQEHRRAGGVKRLQSLGEQAAEQAEKMEKKQ